MITESEGWTIGVMAVCNTAFSVVFFTIQKIEGVGEYMANAEPVWTSPIYGILAIELLLIATVLAFTFYSQQRKTSFL